MLLHPTLTAGCLHFLGLHISRDVLWSQTKSDNKWKGRKEEFPSFGGSPWLWQEAEGSPALSPAESPPALWDRAPQRGSLSAHSSSRTPHPATGCKLAEDRSWQGHCSEFRLDKPRILDYFSNHCRKKAWDISLWARIWTCSPHENLFHVQPKNGQMSKSNLCFHIESKFILGIEELVQVPYGEIWSFPYCRNHTGLEVFQKILLLLTFILLKAKKGFQNAGILIAGIMFKASWLYVAFLFRKGRNNFEFSWCLLQPITLLPLLKSSVDTAAIQCWNLFISLDFIPSIYNLP